MKGAAVTREDKNREKRGGEEENMVRTDNYIVYCVAFLTIYKAKQHTSAPPYLEGRERRVYLTCPPHSFLGIRGHAALGAELCRDPWAVEEQALDLAIRERICQITEETIRETHERVRALVIRKAPLDQLQDVSRVIQQKRHWQIASLLVVPTRSLKFLDTPLGVFFRPVTMPVYASKMPSRSCPT